MRERIQRSGKRKSRKRRKKQNGINSVTSTGMKRKKVGNLLKNLSLLEEAVNSYTINRAAISVYEPSWNILTDSSCISRQAHDNVVTPIYCIIDLRNGRKRNDVVTPFIFPDEWGFNLVPCREFQNRHRISRLPSSQNISTTGKACEMEEIT